METLEELLANLQLNNHIELTDIPDLDLYMDQVIQLFDKTFDDAKRHEKDKVLTKTMINNYAKGGLIPPIKNKKYAKEHMIFLSLIYEMKGVLSIQDIKLTLSELIEGSAPSPEALQAFYTHYLTLSKGNSDKFRKGCTDHLSEVDDLSKDATVTQKHIMMILTLINMSNIYRKAAEKLVDNLTAQQE
ncbi:DUF1836 domain-containing protein [Salipaludibacillus sp. LMS25]|jgi:hypothetical protein|uniref:DUF1836 domain-containing protein n=1 Tax=Salipaludibacillus sp. LMS25 TaxID=2924031 RepID=UPI0020CFFD87|nr:DUF1836 domain-containing protein [Salipaludibacillus sp. LMS25]UTR13292.1 DUF1836 domain-containing protein [Salipaludibacillus sp. LMS25]